MERHDQFPTLKHMEGEGVHTRGPAIFLNFNRYLRNNFFSPKTLTIYNAKRYCLGKKSIKKGTNVTSSHHILWSGNFSWAPILNSAQSQGNAAITILQGLQMKKKLCSNQPISKITHLRSGQQGTKQPYKTYKISTNHATRKFSQVLS